MLRSLFHSVVLMLFMSGTSVFAQKPNAWSGEDYTRGFAKVDTFLQQFNSLSQFRLPGNDTLCVDCMAKFKSLFASNCTYPDLINPVWLSSGEMAFPNRTVMKTVDRFTREIQSNFPGGLMVKYRGINYNFQAIEQDYFEVVIARKTRGQVKNRWRMEVADTILIRVREVDSYYKIQSMDVLGYSYVLPDILELSKTLRGVAPDINLRRQIRNWEHECRKRDSKNFMPALVAEDSVAKYSPCACVDRVPSVAHFNFALRQRLQGSPGYRHMPMIAYSDRNGNYSQVSPDASGESFRELEFLQPFYVVDTAGEFVHLVEYNPAALKGSDYRIVRCLADYGWMRKERLIMGSLALINEHGYETCLSEEQATGSDKSTKTCFRVFQNPVLSNERIEPPAAGKLYVYKKLSNAVLVGNGPQLRPSMVDETILGWRSTNGLVWNNHNNENSK